MHLHYNVKAQRNLKYANYLPLESGMYFAFHKYRKTKLFILFDFSNSSLSGPYVHDNIICVKRGITAKQKVVKLCRLNSSQ